MNPFRFPLSALMGGGSFFSFEPMNLIIEASENLGAVYLGNYEAASDINLLKKYGIHAVLTVAADLRLNYPASEGIAHEVISALDMASFDLSRHFNRCFDFLDKVRAETKTNVLVHCLAGISRSATIVIAYLIKMNKMSFDQAYNFVKKRRKIIFPNPGFVRQLRVFSSQINIKNFVQNDKTKGTTKTKLEESQTNNLRSLSVNNIHKKQYDQQPLNFKTPQKSYNYFNVNFGQNFNEKINNNISLKPITSNPNLKKKNPPMPIKNPYSQNLSKSNKKEMVKSYDKPNGKFMTPSPMKNNKLTKSTDLDNFMFLKKKI